MVKEGIEHHIWCWIMKVIYRGNIRHEQFKGKGKCGRNLSEKRKGSADKSEQDGGRSRSRSERRKTLAEKRKIENKLGKLNRIRQHNLQNM